MIKSRGFTLIELLVVIAIITVVGAIAMVILSDARAKGKDGGRKTQVQEVLKALELYYTDNSAYPNDGAPADTNEGGTLADIGNDFFGYGTYIRRLPSEAGSRYYYCVSANRKSMLIAVNTEEDKGGSEFCSILRGPGPDYGCNGWQTANAGSLCGTRF